MPIVASRRRSHADALSGVLIFKSLGFPLRVHVTKGARHWHNVNERVGFVNLNSHEIVAAAIERKAKALTRYRVDAGSDVRLLLVADRTMNSGKLKLVEEKEFDLHGFNSVYFFSYPEAVIALDTFPEH